MRVQLNRCGVAAALGILAAGLLWVAPASAEDANSGLAAAETGSRSRPNAYDQTFLPPRRTRFIGAGKDQGCLARTDVFNGSRSVSLTNDLRETFL